MHKWIIAALAAVTMSQVIAVCDSHAAPIEELGHKSAVQTFCETIYPEWFRLHSAAAHKHKTIHADIVFDPERGAVTLNRGDDTPAKRVELPQGLKWYAFHVSVHGVKELSFPVVLQRPNHHERRSLLDDEEILIVGDAPETQTYFYIGSRVSGVTAGGSGFSRGISKRKNFEVPLQVRRDPRFRSEVSMLTRDALQKQPSEALQLGGVRVQVIREAVKE